MKTYKDLKEEVLNENTATNQSSFVDRTKTAIMGTPTSDYSKYGMYSAASYGKTQGGLLGKGGTVDQAKKNVGNFASNNRGMIGAGLAGAVALAGITGLLKARQGKRDNAPQSASTPVNLQTTKMSAPGSVGVADKRISPPPTSFSPRKPIDNRDPTRN